MVLDEQLLKTKNKDILSGVLWQHFTAETKFSFNVTMAKVQLLTILLTIVSLMGDVLSATDKELEVFNVHTKYGISKVFLSIL